MLASWNQNCGVVIKGYDLSFPLPAGWTVTKNDAWFKGDGALCVLKKLDGGQSRGPTICIWIGNYFDLEYARKLDTTPPALMILGALSGASDLQEYMRIADSLKITTDDVTQQQTRHPWLNVEGTGPHIVAAMTAITSKNKIGTFFITVAARRESIDETIRVADQLGTHILGQLNSN
jgi:hypothetical protein